MPSFAIVAEGVTDQIVIERMIRLLCDTEEDEVEVNFLQPTRDLTDRHHAPHAGWELVFEYCRTRAAGALATNDYLIVQVDTDQGEHERFGLPLTEGGSARDEPVLVAGATAIIAGHVGEPLYAENRDRIIPAVAVHSLESWLLRILYRDPAILDGFGRLRRRLERADEPPLEKTAARYTALARAVKRKRIKQLVGAEDGLGRFLAAVVAACGTAHAATA